MATNGSGRIPDAWDDDDWGKSQLKQTKTESTDETEELKAPLPPSGKAPIILAKKPTASPNPQSADDISTHMKNMKIWNAANEGGSFEVVTTATQPVKTQFRPEMKILKRATNTNSPEGDPNKTGSGTPKSDAGSDVEGKKETPQEKMERERKEKEERYAKARERLFGPDNAAAAAGGDSMEKVPSSSGKNSGTVTPSGGKSSGQQNKNTPSRKTSPSSRQRRRERVDDDFVPRSAMIAGTVESYHLDQQFQAESQMRDMQSRTHFPQSNMPQSQYMGFPSQYTTSPPPMPGNFGYNNQSVFPQQNQPQPYNPQNMNFAQRQQPPNTGNSPWNSSYSSPGLQPQHHQFNQFQSQGQGPTPYQTQPQQPQQPQQGPPQNYQGHYGPPFPSQAGPGNNMHNQSMPQHQQQQGQGLYDPNYSQKPLSSQQFFNQGGPHGPPTSQFPVREPKAPDGTGRGGFGFAARGGGGNMGSNMMPHPPPLLPQGRGFPTPMFPPNNNPPNVQGGQTGGFNSPAAAAPWGVTNPIGSQRPPAQIWSNMSNGNNNMSGEQGYSGQQQPLMGSTYSGLGQNNVWGNPGMWNHGAGGGQGAGRGKR
ncbi:hypothetical protein TWF694_009937 [Orbilia ellipsospora]|uniref:SUZ domain-containing protein n=1 Tax=Orbilia ellipsospora TaxID=2528407 RepID=A0AAV9XFH7_9PEZI